MSPSPLTLWLADVARSATALEVEVVQRIDNVRAHGNLQPGPEADAVAMIDGAVAELREGLSDLGRALAGRAS